MIAVVGGIVAGSSGAFLSDTETSSGNTFTAGVIDLKVDNESYYNRVLNEGTSWQLDDLDNGRLFFNFADLKPDDEGEDTISLHPGTNDAYVCMDMTLTSDDDKSSNEPELEDGDVQEDINNTWDGELADNLQMFWWADDGDNVYEEGENSISDGIKTLTNLATSSPFSVALADSQNNVWTPNAPGPIPGNSITYIGKAWCFGTLTLSPVAAGQGIDPTVDSGVRCDGNSLNNLTQTDGATVDVAFRAIQARHNSQFTCKGEEPELATITVIKEIVNNNGGNNDVPDFQLFVDNGVVSTPVTSNVATQVSAGSYTVGETGISGYEASFSGDCNASGELVLAPGDNKTCTITNDDLSGNITLVKNVINNNGGTTATSTFKMRIDGVLVPSGSSKSVTANSPHTITEDAQAGYSFVSITGNAKCPAVLGGTVTLDEGEAITCTITNDDNAPITLLNDSFGTGNNQDDIPDWEEEGQDNNGDARAQNATDNASDEEGFSPADGDGTGRFAKIDNGEWICRSINATGYNTLSLGYYWRGDNDAEDGSPDFGLAEYATGGTCDSPTGLSSLATHELDNNPAGGEVWSSLQSVGLPVALDGTTFLLRFRNTANASSEDFRIDGVTVTGTAA
ncbi:MAG: hypothetical protein HW401_304 [Parcubacteria group bacterium]|nr:hypothetical protein [Parcubacteria group bacterium]